MSRAYVKSRAKSSASPKLIAKRFYQSLFNALDQCDPCENRDELIPAETGIFGLGAARAFLEMVRDLIWPPPVLAR